MCSLRLHLPLPPPTLASSNKRSAHRLHREKTISISLPAAAVVFVAPANSTLSSSSRSPSIYPRPPPPSPPPPPYFFVARAHHRRPPSPSLSSSSTRLRRVLHLYRRRPPALHRRWEQGEKKPIFFCFSSHVCMDLYVMQKKILHLKRKKTFFLVHLCMDMTYVMWCGTKIRSFNSFEEKRTMHVQMYELVPDVDLLLYYMFWFLISRIARSL